MSWAGKVPYLRSRIKRYEVKRNNNPIICLKPRKFNSSYYIKAENNEFKQVCINFLCKLLQISRTKLFRATSAMIANPFDRRGLYSSRKVSQEDINFAKACINKFPKYGSNQPNTFSYMHPNLNLRKMYRKYSAICDENQRAILSETYFRKIFNRFFKLKFSTKSRKPSCRKCNEFNKLLKTHVISPAFREEVLNEQQKHFKIVESIKRELHHTVEDAMQITSKTEVLLSLNKIQCRF